MIERNALKLLKKWKNSTHRKPLVIRGARQTGKTTLVESFADCFDDQVSLNLEHSTDRSPWEGSNDVDSILRNIELIKNKKIVPGKTLLFLDEIQHEGRAVQSLRYFYEQKPDLHVIATGSLLEVGLQEKGFSFPVGRVSFLYLFPLTFEEFLRALGKTELLEELHQLHWKCLPSPTLEKLAAESFSEYLYLGGMPEIVNHFLQEKSYQNLAMLKEGLLTSFEEDVPKYAKKTKVPLLQLLIRQAPQHAGQRIKYENFADSGQPSRTMKQALETLEKAMILQRVLPTTNLQPPLLEKQRVGPKLLYLDVGLVTHRFKVDPRTLQQGNLNELFRGSLAEQVVGQELLATNNLQRETPHFWLRNKAQSNAEIDYLITIAGKLIPIEVKSGKTGTLRSLHEFMKKAPHPFAVRIYSGPMRVDAISHGNTNYHLFSIPFYLTFRLPELIETWIQQE